jgi:hypothetical protein
LAARLLRARWLLIEMRVLVAVFERCRHARRVEGALAAALSGTSSPRSPQSSASEHVLVQDIGDTCLKT